MAVDTLLALLSGTFLQTLPELVTPLKGHSLSAQLSTDAVKAFRNVWVLKSAASVGGTHTPSIAFRHLPPNSEHRFLAPSSKLCQI